MPPANYTANCPTYLLQNRKKMTTAQSHTGSRDQVPAQALTRYLRSCRKKLICKRTAWIWLWIAVCFCAAHIFIHLAFAVFPWTVLPLVWDLTVISTAIALTAAVLDALLIRRPSLNHIATMLDTASGLDHPGLRIALQLHQRTSHSSRSLAARYIADTESSLDMYPRTVAVAGLRNASIAAVLLIPSAVFVTLVTSEPVFRYWREPLISGSFSYRIFPGTCRIPSHRDTTLRFVPRTEFFSRGVLHTNSLNSPVEKTRLLFADSNGTFSFRTDTLTHSLAYRFTAGAHTSNPETLYVVQPPRMRRLSVIVHPPSYTGLAPDTLPPGQGSFSAFAGSPVRIALASHFPLSDAGMVFTDGDTISLQIQGDTVLDTIPLRKRGEYRFVLTDTIGQHGGSDIRFRIDVRKDLPPSVRITSPGRNITLSSPASETLTVNAGDDFGISSVRLHWWHHTADSATVRTRALRNISSQKKNGEWHSRLFWHLDKMTIYPGDTVFYTACATDNAPARHRSCSDTFWYRLPTLAQMHEKMARDEDALHRSLSSAQHETEQIEKELSRMIREQKWNKKLSWDEQQVIKNLASKITSQRDSLNEALQSFQKSVTRLKNEGTLNEALLDKMEQLRKSVEEITKEFGDSVLFDMHSKDSLPGHRDLREALNRMQQQLPELSEQIDHALEFLEKLKAQQRLAALSSRAQNLAASQKEHARQNPASYDADSTARQTQQRILDSVGTLLAGVRAYESSQWNTKSSLFPAQHRVDSARAGIQHALDASTHPGAETMNRMSASLLGLSSQLEAQMTHSMASKMQQDRTILLGMLRTTVHLSRWQQQVISKAGHFLSYNNEGGSHAETQEVKISLREQMSALRNALAANQEMIDSLSALPPFITSTLRGQHSRALDIVDSSRAAIGQGPDARTAIPLKRSRTALHMLARTIYVLIDRLDDSMQKSSMAMQQSAGMMQKISGSQAALNAMTSQLLNNMMKKGTQGIGNQGKSPASSSTKKGARPGNEGMRVQARKEQKRIAQKLEELARQYKKEARSDKARHARRLKEEAERIARMLQDPANKEVKEQQEKLLTRMLEASLSVHKKGRGSDTRKGEKATETFTEVNAREPDLRRKQGTDAVQAYLELRKKILDGNYPSYYFKNIRTYLDSLGNIILKGE